MTTHARSLVCWLVGLSVLISQKGFYAFIEAVLILLSLLNESGSTSFQDIREVLQR